MRILRALFIVALLALGAAAQTTPNINLNDPAVHTTGWDVLLNNNWLSLDALLSGNQVVPGFLVQPSTDVPGLTVQCANVGSPVSQCAQVLDKNSNPLLKVLPTGVTFGTGASGRLSGLIGIGTGTASNTDFAGELTNSGGVSTFTFTGTYVSHPICVANDETSIAAVKVTYTGSTAVTFTTAGATDVVNYVCVARN